MKKKFIAGVSLFGVVALLGASVIGYQDWQVRGSAPGSPASGYVRTWIDSVTGGLVQCKNSSGAACYFQGALHKTNGSTNSIQTLLNLAAGTNVTLSESGGTVTINSSGGGGGSTAGTIWSGSADPNGSTLFSPINMSSNTAPPPYVASSSLGAWSGSQQEFNCFDSSGSLYQSASAPPGTLEIDLGSASQVMTIYSLMTTVTNAAPTAWTLQGSNNNTTWTTLDTEAFAGWASGVTYTYYASSPGTTAYRYYRLNVSTFAGGSVGFILNAMRLYYNSSLFTSGTAGDFYLQTTTKKLFGPRPSGSSGFTWPLAGTLN